MDVWVCSIYKGSHTLSNLSAGKRCDKTSKNHAFWQKYMGAVYQDFVKMEPEQVAFAQRKKSKKREPSRDNTKTIPRIGNRRNLI